MHELSSWKIFYLLNEKGLREEEGKGGLYL